MYWGKLESSHYIYWLTFQFQTPPIVPAPIVPATIFVSAISRMARRSFTLPPLKLTKRPPFSASVRYQGVRGVQTQLEPCQENLASYSEFPVSADQDSETDHCGELTMYEIETNTSMAGWEAIREGLLSAVTESQGMPSSQMCVLCDDSPALIRCRQCGPRSYYCQICFDTVHSWISFLYVAEQWMVRCLNTLNSFMEGGGFFDLPEIKDSK